MLTPQSTSRYVAHAILSRSKTNGAHEAVRIMLHIETRLTENLLISGTQKVGRKRVRERASKGIDVDEIEYQGTIGTIR